MASSNRCENLIVDMSAIDEILEKGGATGRTGSRIELQYAGQSGVLHENGYVCNRRRATEI